MLAHGLSSRRSAFPERAAESCPPGASVPLRADGCALRRSGLLARGSPPQPAFPNRLTQWRRLAEGPRSQLRDSSGFAPDSLGALIGILAVYVRLIGPSQPEVTGLSGDGHREAETVWLE